jgi:RNA polymerase sigma-70 factor (ECF subfamily)
MVELTQYVTFEERGLAESENAAAREARFADLVQRRSRFAFQVAYAILRNAQDAEDVLRETFLKLYRTGAWETMRDERALLRRAVCAPPWTNCPPGKPSRSLRRSRPEVPELRKKH